MNLRRVALIGIVALGAIALGGCRTQSQTTSATSTQASDTSQSASGEAMVDQTVITFDGTSFSPSELRAKAGESIAVKNMSTGIMQFSSDPHPTHTLFPELNLGAIGPGSSRTFTISKSGTYSYHNHLNPSQKGTIVVE